tara:strand:+ start:4251 stop:4445 length:195 start_codon:yes stop_codon:yes gene_type:complete
LKKIVEEYKIFININNIKYQELNMNDAVERSWSNLSSEVTYEEWRKMEPGAAMANVSFLTEILV